MKLDFKWIENKGRFSSGESVYLNRIRIGSYGWNSARRQGSGDPDYVGEITLPSLSAKTKRVYSDTQEEIKTKMEAVIKGWFKEAHSET